MRRSGDSWDKRYAVWLMAYWLAFLVNAGFDVFLEGPMGGVLFWSLIGLSLVYFTGGTRDANRSEDERGAPKSSVDRSAVHTAQP